MSAALPSRTRHVAAVPYPGRGHVNPMINLCRCLDVGDVLISFFVTEEWAHLISSSPPLPPCARLVAIPNCIPSEIGRGKDFAGFLDAVFTRMEEPFENALEGIAPAVDAIVADIYLPWAVAVGNRRNIPVYSLNTMSASVFSAQHHFDRIRPAVTLAGLYGHVTAKPPAGADEWLGNHIPAHSSIRLSDLRSILASERVMERALEAFSMARRSQGLLFTSFYELEAEVIDALRRDVQCPVYAVGPSVPYTTLDERPTDGTGWLDSQPERSVLYVSLGSFHSVSGAQMEEIAGGLRASGVRFLWVARGDSLRMQEMAGGAGMVVPWCDQMRVLSHPSVGGFLTHCGWNSTLEGVFCGVPMLAFPIFWDQPVDARLVVDEWKVGLSLRGDVGGEIVVGQDEIALVIKKLMDLEDAEGKAMRKRAAELRGSARRAVEAGGSSSTNIHAFLRGLVRNENGA